MFKFNVALVVAAVLMMMMYITSVSAQQSNAVGILAEKKQNLASLDNAIASTKDLIQGAVEFGAHELQASYVKQKKEQLVELSELRNVLQYEVDFLSKQVPTSSRQNGMVINSVNTPTTKEEKAAKQVAEELKLKQEAEAKALAEKQAAEKKAKEAEAKQKGEQEAAAKLKAEKEAAEKKAQELAAQNRKSEFTIEAACDNSYSLYINGGKVISGDSWGSKQKTKVTLTNGDLISVRAFDMDGLGGLLVNIYNDKGQQFNTGSSTWNCKVGDLSVSGDEFLSWPVGVKAPHSDNYGVTKQSGSHWIWTKSQQKGYITCAQRIKF
ncbi:predicted protein [Naegleria gruberi]|uniref:Predicted protein n=1 Tax=Naegleria gruberi TaxID=5762 RepID=D2VCP1_NAEGR|nr:uncharacterized protein NAEGRDRAFT_66642 [Naegleria gruberi]EFC45456.1 predicted protein [Naegleria gruberi]|eukprot:XP_002678200.1 predicted protein [Naegleria gruberi strain NEG-M]